MDSFGLFFPFPFIGPVDTHIFKVIFEEFFCKYISFVI